MKAINAVSMSACLIVAASTDVAADDMKQADPMMKKDGMMKPGMAASEPMMKK